MMVQAGLPIMDFGSMQHIAEHIPWEQQIGNSLVVREPVGVVGAITPWNYPLHQIAAKVAPAMVAGCTVVLKPSEVTPLTAFVLAEIFDEVGVPAGVLNLVTGYGPVVGEAIASHPGVDMVRSPAPPAPAGGSASSPRRTSRRSPLELGGKSPNIILDDADLETAVVNGIQKCYFNSGRRAAPDPHARPPRSSAGRGDRRGGRLADGPVGDPFEEVDPARPACLRRPA